MTERCHIFNATHVGFNHEKKGLECEDFSGNCDGKYIKIIAVADGHGSNNYPRTKIGSKLAVESAMKCIQDFDIAYRTTSDYKDKTLDKILGILTMKILRQWEKLVFSDADAIPFSDDELSKVAEKYKILYSDKSNITKAYGSTLIVAAITDDFCFGIQIGDGKLVLVDQHGICTQPIPEDKNCFSNVTTSLSDKGAINEFRTFISFDVPSAIFIGTDGIDNSYPSDDDLYGLYKSIIRIYYDTSIQDPIREIQDYLPILTKKGSGDDVSLAGVISFAYEPEKSQVALVNNDNQKLAISEIDEQGYINVVEVNDSEIENNSHSSNSIIVE